MIRTLRALLCSFALAIGLCAPVALTTGLASAATASQQAACQGIGLSGAGCGQRAGAEQRVGGLIGTIVSVLSLIVGIAAVIMIIVSGLKYITGGGDPQKVSSAKNTLIYALVGLVIVALAQFIVRFVLVRV